MLRLRKFLPALLVLAGLLLVTASPGLMLLAVQLPLPWGQLSDVGQAYGAVSAVMSGLALLSVAGSLVIQQRQNRMTEEQTVRQRHFDLVRLTLDDLKFLYSWGFAPDVEYDPALVGFSNLILTHWLMLWRIGHVDERMLRSNARVFFAGEVGRDHWRRDGGTWPAIDRRDKQFIDVLNDEYRRAIEMGPPTVVPPRRARAGTGAASLGSARTSSDRLHTATTRPLLWSALAAAAVGGYLAGRRRRGTHHR
jgi:hypothetical protein